MCSKKPGRVFSEVAEAPQAARTQTHRAMRPETGEKIQLIVHNFDMLQQNAGFSQYNK